MIKAIQEQQEQIKTLQQELAELKATIGRLTVVKTAYLEQNIPNPVNGTTMIRYHLPAGTTSAILSVTNSSGQLIKAMTLNIGSGQARLETSKLAAGVYSLTLNADGKLADTKRMVITR